MKATVDKCEQCGALFEDEKQFVEHCKTHQLLTMFEGAFPKVVDDECRFANGGWTVQRDKDWLDRYRDRIVEVVGDIGYPPESYGWFRCLDDGGNPFYALACRMLHVCRQCYREWGQPYHANKCNHADKPKSS